ncbi:eCIS core domain-containing protein [Nostoc sp.]|uniref:eCIS core domain-containing protein n=1 Tax=Nostoc sp. TaxID=1180 RepID=UPI002FF84093
MREHVSQSKKATTASFSIPSLKHRIPGFGLDSSQASPQAVPLVQPLYKPLTHDISRIPLRNPQAKLSISQPGDKYEQEADSVAQQVMQRIAQPINRQSIQPEAMPEESKLQMKPLANSITPVLQRQSAPGDESELQMKSLGNSTLQRQEVPEDESELQMKPMVQRRAEARMADAPDLEASINQARGGGQVMAKNIRQPMEVAFGADFSGVKVHTDGQSDQLNRSIQARAFTTGQDVFFRQGEYNPGSRGGQELLAHELTHVVQQNGGAVQRSPLLQREKRSNNPHNPQTGVTSHHIIPHELLLKIKKKFNDGKEKDELMSVFLPNFDSLTLSNFVAQVSVGVEYDNTSPNKVTDLPKEVATKTFGQLTGEEQGKTKFKVEDAGIISFDKFKTLYGQLKRGEELKNDQDEPVSGLRDLGDSFFEWQSGNLFYGPERIEPGAKDGFDYDAKFIYGEAFIRQLEKIYNQLRSLEGKEDQASKLEMQERLKEMAALTKDTNVPEYDPSLWIAIDSEAKKSVHDTLLPERRQTSENGLSIHRQVLKSTINKYSNNKNLAHEILSYTKEQPKKISQENVFGASTKTMYLKEASNLKVDMKLLKSMDTVKNAMSDTLIKFFGL